MFLDADTLVLQNIDELFDREELSAAPDIGWPDCFNSGVFVFVPSLDTFKNLLDMARQTGSFDGGLCGGVGYVNVGCVEVGCVNVGVWVCGGGDSLSH